MNELSYPGQTVGYVEEFAPEEGVREIDEKLVAVLAGKKQEDKNRRAISIQSRKIARPIRAGDEVYGIVRDIYEAIALIEIAPPEYDGERAAVGASYMFIRISEISNAYIENFRDVLRIGDILKARVLELQKLGSYITMKEPGLGVVKAFCSNCRKPLQDQGRFWQCNNCGNRETRKSATTQAQSNNQPERNAQRNGGEKRWRS
ncbi:MAG TPA: exosome complex RNA-binding protein Csl4 [Candidatus Norongarragalinales archaeon]|jgi:exosome complex component CSL4|nr:exosome complex RNA-binding protein Csl4 [Candidatus Norongarragalinales archaeon]